MNTDMVTLRISYLAIENPELGPLTHEEEWQFDRAGERVTVIMTQGFNIFQANGWKRIAPGRILEVECIDKAKS